MPRRCAIIGAGRVGSTLGGRLLAAGWEVKYASRNPTHSHKLRDALKQQPGTSGGGVAEAVEWAGEGGAVLLAVPGSALGTEAACASFARSLGPVAAGKIVIDATNPLDKEGNELCWERGYSSAEMLQELLPGGLGGPGMCMPCCAGCGEMSSTNAVSRDLVTCVIWGRVGTCALQCSSVSADPIGGEAVGSWGRGGLCHQGRLAERDWVGCCHS